MPRWELNFEDLLFALVREEITLEDIKDEDMQIAAALTVDRLNYVTSMSEEQARKTLAPYQLEMVERLKDGMTELIDEWQGNNWRRANV